MSGVHRAKGAAVLLGVLAVAACTPGAPERTPPPTPPPSVSQSPSETPQERQERLDYAAAEKAYRTFRAEFDRVLRAGGATKPTKLMRATAAGEYLETFTKVIQGFKVLDSRQTGRERITYVRRTGYSRDNLILEVCEDSRAVETVRKNGKNERGDIIAAKLKVRRFGNEWKVWDGEGKVVKACE